MENGKIIQLEDRVPKLKLQKRKKSNRRLILYISILFLLVLFLIYFRSPFSNIGSITVKGNHYMTKQQVLKTAGITLQSSYFRVVPEQVEKKLKEKAEVKHVVVSKILPNKIDIHITEYKTIGFLQTEKGPIPLLENGQTMPAVKNKKLPVAAPLLVDFSEKEKLVQLSEELKLLSDSVFRSISEIKYTPKGADALHVTLYMNEGYEVSATIQDFAKRMEAYPLILKQVKSGSKARIHLDVAAYIEYINEGGATP
ncbi:FtsQ-type POTRA domain-containing protein [Ectobacillus antri]|jgi:cell division protein FtsQ|uniref:Cell division protein DivIB n=1 Tax=Ectobacillus antri TaxID=2486280 RepID=A0ABT6H0R4_9BACI|nr:FtsQ-type POTRA domain-containing protein [Ectobacillus antri]MDG4655837.1 FtsQ-type POTRA domain-containing protein [Ectobacillus antri]MDG5752512.1 FtsQ-type POTRA domain-containing protein [Ectobacillus antri]